MSFGYLLALRCPHCGAELEHVADGVAARWETRVVCRCGPCRTRFTVTVHLSDVSQLAMAEATAERSRA